MGGHQHYCRKGVKDKPVRSGKEMNDYNGKEVSKMCEIGYEKNMKGSLHLLIEERIENDT